MTSVNEFKSKTLKESGLIRRDSPNVTTDTKTEDVVKALAQDPHFVVILDPAKRFKGIFSTSDLDKVNTQNMNREIQNLIVDKGIVSVDPEQSLEDVAQKFKESKHRVLPVLTKDNKYEGVVTSANFLEKLRSDVKVM